MHYKNQYEKVLSLTRYIKNQKKFISIKQTQINIIKETRNRVQNFKDRKTNII